MTIAELIDSGILGLTVLAALVGAIGSLLGVILKDFFFSRSFERWKAGQALQQIYVRYANPIFFAASELCNRLEEICEWYPAPFLDSNLLNIETERMQSNAANDPYYKRYKLISSIYRFRSFLGWLELLRQEIVFLESGKSAKNRVLERKLETIRSDLADGQLNTSSDWVSWQDRLLFREEQRAIGERMITRSNHSLSVIGYAEFCAKLERSAAGDKDQWLGTALSFLVGPSTIDKNFHLVRLKRLIVHLVELMKELNPSKVSEEQKEWLRKFSSQI